MTLPVSVINGRFKAMDRPNTAPGHCAVCGSVSKPVIDFDMTLDYYGAVLLCVDCIREAFTLLGALYPELMAPAQVAPLYNGNVLDVGTVHEYLGLALESTRRLVAILPDSDILDADVYEADREDAGEALGTNPNVEQLTLIEGPDDVPTITGRTTRSIFDD